MEYDCCVPSINPILNCVLKSIFPHIFFCDIPAPNCGKHSREKYETIYYTVILILKFNLDIKTISDVAIFLAICNAILFLRYVNN